MIYDYIFIGASLSNLLKATTIKNKNILIIEKDKYFGGAWRVDYDKYQNLDLVGHLIVPPDNVSSENIIKFFRKLI